MPALILGFCRAKQGSQSAGEYGSMAGCANAGATAQSSAVAMIVADISVFFMLAELFLICFKVVLCPGHHGAVQKMWLFRLYGGSAFFAC
jgi:hypothetical protein